MRERPILMHGRSVRAITPAMREYNARRRVHLDDARVTLMFYLGWTAKEIAAEEGCSTHPVKKALVRLGLRRPAKQRPGRMAGANNHQWKGGRRTRTDGYVEIWTRSGVQLEHRAVMERALRRSLRSDEIVHHKDRNRQNNDISNLELTTASEHAREHVAEMHAARYGQ